MCQQRRYDGASGSLPVTVSARRLCASDPFSTYLAVRNLFGSDDCYILESLDGPAVDRSTAVVGFGRVLRLTVRDCAVELFGADRVVEVLRERLIAEHVAYDNDGSLVLAGPTQFWQLQRVVRDTFPVVHAGDERLFFGGFIAYGYDAARHIEALAPLPRDDTSFPELVLLVHRAAVIFELQRGETHLATADCPAWPSLDVADLATVLDAPPEPMHDIDEVPQPSSVEDSATFSEFVRSTHQALDHIAAGDVYQVQIGHRLSVTSQIDELLVYRRLRERNPSPYMCLVDFGDVTLISASPELFMRLDAAGRLRMRPVAGTTARSADDAENARRAAGLAADPKEKAEHLMLVDLCRNDLGRVARPGSVQVDQLMTLEGFSHVYHLVSTVTAELEPAFDAIDAIRAVFPAGTVTGAPKVRAMEIIQDLEHQRREGYAGAFGLLDFCGPLNTGLCIRTIFRRGQTYTLQASAGIVADSTPDREWQETLAKLNGPFWAVTGRTLL